MENYFAVQTARFTLRHIYDHALKCRKGGLIIRRHNDVCGELQRLAEKWERAYSQVFGFIKARMSVAILRASSQFLRGPRSRVQGVVCVMEDGAALAVARL